MPRHIPREEIRAGCISNARQIAEQCRQNGLRAGVVVVIVPLDEPQPEYASAVVGNSWEAAAAVAALEKVQEQLVIEAMTVRPKEQLT